MLERPEILNYTPDASPLQPCLPQPSEQSPTTKCLEFNSSLFLLHTYNGKLAWGMGSQVTFISSQQGKTCSEALPLGCITSAWRPHSRQAANTND